MSTSLPNLFLHPSLQISFDTPVTFPDPGETSTDLDHPIRVKKRKLCTDPKTKAVNPSLE